ncbi:MAG: DUF3990 domain-containing protein [Bacilli bacterium]|nr:DUF3990 domain-containing protein [Bacilli bacterium]
MIIYHGSKKIINNPLYKGSNPSNDYGPAFYVTKDLESAKSWACKNNTIGIVSKYNIDNKVYSSLKVLDLTDKNKYSVLNWIAILMHFRTLDSHFVKNNEIVLNWLSKYYINVNDYDVIIGYRADDTYFRFPIRFISNDLAFEDLESVFKSGNLGVQLALISQKAIDSLKYVGDIECDDSFLGHYFSLVKDASNNFDILINKPRDPSKTYVLDLMRQEHE